MHPASCYRWKCVTITALYFSDTSVVTPSIPATTSIKLTTPEQKQETGSRPHTPASGITYPQLMDIFQTEFVR